MVDYSNGKIYRLYCNITKKCYVGSTTQSLSKRLSQHKQNYKCFLNGKYHFVSSFEILENNDYVIVLIENYECKNKEELFKRERFYIEQMECVNQQLPIRSNKEWVEDNKEKIKEYRKNYYINNREKYLDIKKQNYQNNRDKILDYVKQYAVTNQELIKEYRKKCYEENKQIYKERNKTYRENNKEKIKQMKKAYAEKNKDKIREKNKKYREQNKDKIRERKKQYYERTKLSKSSISTTTII